MSRKSVVSLSAVAALLIIGLLSWVVIDPSSSSVAQAESAELLRGSAAIPPKQAATPSEPPPGSIAHTVAKGESVPSLVQKYLPSTPYMTGKELETAIRGANPGLKGLWLKPGQQVVIPEYRPMPWVEKSIIRPKDFEVRAIYLTGIMAGSANGQKIVRRWKEVGGNSVVFDIKDSDGSLSVKFEHPLAPKQKSVSIRNLPKYTRFLHEQGMHAIARIAIFRDEHVVVHHPQTGVKSRRTGAPWRENGALVWTDPSNKDVQDYNIALAKFVAESGADEIQFDYVRFPAEGDQKDAQFGFETKNPEWKRANVIADFLARAQKELKPTGVLFSLDVFGVMAWQRSVDLAHTGQDIPQMAKYCDVLSPMIYPSHFFGMDGYALPGDAPEHFISESMKKFEKITAGSGVVLRPWLQAFGWKTRTYSPEYIATQVRSSKANGGVGFLFWNASNDYSKPYAAMPGMRAKADLYFRVEGSATGEMPRLVPAAVRVNTAR